MAHLFNKGAFRRGRIRRRITRQKTPAWCMQPRQVLLRRVKLEKFLILRDVLNDCGVKRRRILPRLNTA